MANLNVAVIGAGNMGANHIRIYDELPSVNLVAISDVNADTCQFMRDKYDVPVYNNYLEMLSSVDVDAISVCVPTSFHYEVAMKCMKSGKHVLVEKPIADRLDLARELIDFSCAAGTIFMVGHIERFNPAVQRLKKILDSGELGEVISVMARRVGVFPPQIRDVNIAVDLAIHDIDIVNYLLDEYPVHVVHQKKKNHIKLREDSIDIFMTYKRASAYIQSNWVTPVKIRKLNITGQEGYLEMDYIDQSIELYKSSYEKTQDDSSGDFSLKYLEPEKISIKLSKKEPLKEEIKFFIDLVNSGRYISSDYALKALELALG